jgi:hypothetical protein
MGTLYLGVDLHVRTQMVCWMNTAMGSCISGNSITSTTTCVGFTRSCRGRRLWE